MFFMLWTHPVRTNRLSKEPLRTRVVAQGLKLDLVSIDQTTGMVQIDGTATVSADGLSVRSDPGQGVTHPGLYGLAPPGGIIFAGGAPPLHTRDYIAIQLGISQVTVRRHLSAAYAKLGVTSRASALHLLESAERAPELL